MVKMLQSCNKVEIDMTSILKIVFCIMYLYATLKANIELKEKKEKR